MPVFLRYLLAGIGILLFLILGIPSLKYSWYFLGGRYIGSGLNFSATVSDHIVAKHLPAKECLKIAMNPFELFPYPSLGSLVDGCIAGVAYKSKDPTACELLMPNDFGMDCVGGATKELPCIVNSNYAVQWREKDAIQRSSLQDCQTVKKDRSSLGNQCCIIASVRLLKPMNDCSPLEKDSLLFDQCIYELAFKNNDPTECTVIKDSNILAACKISSKYARSCRFCSPALNSIKDLPVSR